jgi:hypothetical protein
MMMMILLLFLQKQNLASARMQCHCVHIEKNTQPSCQPPETGAIEEGGDAQSFILRSA